MTLLALPADAGGLNYRTGDTVLAAMPFFHVAGVNVALIAMASGARSAILRDAAPQLILATIAKERVNHAFLAPALLQMLMQAPGIGDADLSSMRSLTYGASPISEDLLRRASARFGCEFVQLYGMTETCGAGTFLPIAAHDPAKGKLRSCGVAWPGVDIKIVSAEGAEVPRGAVGEVVDPLARRHEGLLEQARRDRSLDPRRLDADGRRRVHGRRRIRLHLRPRERHDRHGGGECVSGRGRECPVWSSGNRGCGCDRRPRRTWGEAVKAIVVLKPGAPPDVADIIAWARARIAHFKAPKSVDFVDAIPRNLSGKILRRELREPYWKGRDRRVN